MGDIQIEHDSIDIIEPGTIGLTLIEGIVGDLIEAGQFLNGEGLTRNEHAFTLLPGGMILEAEPGGARIVPYHYGTNVYWCRNPVQASGT